MKNNCNWDHGNQEKKGKKLILDRGPNGLIDRNEKRFYLTVFLFVVLLCDVCFIVLYVFFCAIFHGHIRMTTKQIRKNVFPLTLRGGRTLNFPLGEPKSQWGDAYLLQFKYWLYFHSQLMALFHSYDTDTEINISC